MKNINRNQTELWCFVNPSHLPHIHLHCRGLAAKSSSFWNIYVLMPYPITIFESQPFSDLCSTLITADQCLTLWYMFSHNWRSTVLSFPWSQVFCNNFLVSLRLENDALCRPHKMSNLASPDLFPAPLHFLRTRLNQLAFTKFGRSFRYPIT